MCYHYDEVYTPGHRCKQKHIFLIITEEEEAPLEAETEQEVAMMIQGEEGELLQIENNCGISIHAITGTKGFHTIKLQGQGKGKPISMLLDSGSTHNFISQTLVKKIQLTTEPCFPIKVTVENGETISCKRKITQFGWKLAQGEFQTPMYVIPLGVMMQYWGFNGCKLLAPSVWILKKRKY